MYACALQSFHLFLPLLKGDQFHTYMYLTAQTQNAVSGICLNFFTKPTCTKT